MKVILRKSRGEDATKEPLSSFLGWLEEFLSEAKGNLAEALKTLRSSAKEGTSVHGDPPS
jgi:hypothetical protein